MAPPALVTAPSSSIAVAIGCCQARDPGVAVTNRREQNKVAREYKVSRTEVFGVSGGSTPKGVSGAGHGTSRAVRARGHQSSILVGARVWGTGPSWKADENKSENSPVENPSVFLRCNFGSALHPGPCSGP